MFNRPRYSAGQTLFSFLVGLAMGTLTVNVIIADNLSELVGDLPKGRIIGTISLLRALADMWAQYRLYRDDKAS